MIQEFEKYIKNKNNFSSHEKKNRSESLKSFIQKGFPNKRMEDWKFTDLNQIINKNFRTLKVNKSLKKVSKLNLIKDFEHNYISLINGVLNTYNFNYENSKKIKIKKYTNNSKEKSKNKNPLVDLNDALYDRGYFLEIFENYKLKKPLIIYNKFEGKIKDNLINNKNLIILNDNSDLVLIEYNTDISKDNYIQNNFTDIILGKNSSLKFLINL